MLHGLHSWMTFPLRTAIFARHRGGDIRRRGRNMISLVCSLATCIVLTTLFCSTVVRRPSRTPLFTLAASYGPAWDLNPWVAEDLQAIDRLNESTFAVSALPEVDLLAGGVWDGADAMLRPAMRQSRGETPLVIYVNLHGAVNDAGQPCWIPPDAIPHDSSTWWPIQNLLEHLVQLQQQTCRQPIVLLLECNRVHSHLPAGITNNAFDEKLGQLVASFARRHPKQSLTILSAAERGQRSLASADGTGDVFTRELVRGLHGEADVDFGDADGVVDVAELHEFTRQRVSEWAWRFRGTVQTPSLHCSASQPSLALGRTGRRPSLSPRSSFKIPSEAELNRWQRAVAEIRQLRSTLSITADPVVWSQVLRTSQAIDQALFGGNAAREKIDAWYARLDDQLQQLRGHLPTHHTDAVSPTDRMMLRQGIAIWSALRKQPSLATATGLLADLDDDQLMPTPMLQALVAHPELAAWKHLKIIEQLASTQQTWLSALQQTADELFPAAAQLTAPVDQSRRQLADRLLTWTSLNPAQAGTDFQSIRDAVDRFRSEVNVQSARLRQLTEACARRDRAYLELPSHVAWMRGVCDDSNRDTESIELAESDAQHLDQMLTRLLDGTTSWESTFHDQIVDASQRIQQHLQTLQQMHTAAMQSLGTPGKSLPTDDRGARAARVACAAEFPLLLTDPHHRLAAANALRHFDRQDNAHTGGSQATAKDTAAVMSRLRSNAASAQRVLASLLGLPEQKTNAGDVRRRLRDCVQGDVSPNARQGSWRAALGLVSSDELQPRATLTHRAARRNRLACEVAAVIDDFWFAPAAGGSPYFSNAAVRLLDLADQAAFDDVHWRKRRSQLSQLLETRKAAATKGIALQAALVPGYEDSAKSQVAVTIDAAEVGTSLPAGLASLSILPNASSQLAGSTGIRPIVLSPTRPLTDPVRMEMPEVGGGAAVAQLRFRGHRFQSDGLASATARGVTLSPTVEKKQTSITVHPRDDTQHAICFVLDCSASMHDPVQPEVAQNGGPLAARMQSPAAATKLDAARGSLLAMLRRLENSATEVGVVLYGHRMAIGTGDQGLLLQKRYHDSFPFPPTLQPFEDVEIVLPTGRFTSIERDLARQRFDAVVPWGQTPLHLAISEAIDDVVRHSAGPASSSADVRDVVVISDGRNYQFNPTPDAVVDMTELIEKARRHNVRVHIIGFGVDDEQAEQAAEEFAAITSATGGETFAQIDRATELLQQLQHFSSPASFSISTEQGDARNASLGDTLPLPQVGEVNSVLQLKIADTTTLVPISPGDQLQFIADPSTGQVQTSPYRKHHPQMVPLVDPHGRPAQAQLGVHQPQPHADGLTFEFSFQRADRQLSERPALTWLEIVPRSQSSDSDNQPQPPAYRAAALNWRSGMSCPVGQLTCRDWPRNSVQFSVQAWCCAAKPEGTTISVPIDGAGEITPPQMPDVRCRLNASGKRIQLRCRYKSDLNTTAMSDPMLIVQLSETDQRTILAQTHWYDSANRESVHSFTLDASHAAEAKGDAAFEFWVCRIDQAKADGVRTAHPVTGSRTAAIALAPATASQR